MFPRNVGQVIRAISRNKGPFALLETRVSTCKNWWLLPYQSNPHPREILEKRWKY